MNTIYIEKPAYSYLREWADKDRLKCSLAEPFFRKCEIRKKDNPECVLYVESKGLKRKFSLKFNKTIVFRPFQNQLYAASVGRHRSPEGVFQVRGHFRRYKTGKVIWIDGFMKGVDKIDN